MLCGKIIITNENREEIQRLLDTNKNNFIDFQLNFYVNKNLDEEVLYDVCCNLAEYIAKVYITNDIYCHIENNYTCFNSDEKKIIRSFALSCEEIGELPGRIYIFLKAENSINLFGFYKFMCKDIKASVYDASTEEAERLVSLNDAEDFIELLKYFASMSPLCTQRVDIIAKKHSMKIVNSSSDNSYNAEFATLDPMPEDILSELVTLNPEKIVVHGKEFYEKSEFSVIINGVFKGRVSYCDGCYLCREE